MAVFIIIVVVSVVFVIIAVVIVLVHRYGREDLDVLGLTFRKDLFLATYQGEGEGRKEER